MGSFLSCETTPARRNSKAKLILEDGGLEEFSSPINVSQISKRNPSCFICNADDMNYDDYIMAIRDDEELELGQLYFELPEDWLKSRLTSHQMASLAVKASIALSKGGKWGKGSMCYLCGLRRIDPMKSIICRDEEGIPILARGGAGVGGGRRNLLSRNLSVILEEEDEGKGWSDC